MKRPIRLNRDFLRKAWPNLDRGCPDPRGLLRSDIGAREATAIIAKIKIGGVFKTTSYQRFPETTQLLANIPFSSPPVILDVGASDGSSSLSIMEVVSFARYYVTDRHIEAYACKTRSGAFFCDAEHTPFMYANELFVIYNDMKKALWPLSAIARKLFSGFDISNYEDVRKVILMNPELQRRIGGEIRLERYNIFEPWPHEKANLVIAANILNRGYFSDSQLNDALRNLKGALKNFGRLALIENRPAEQSNIFRLQDGKFVVESEVGRGSDIKSLVTTLGDVDVSEVGRPRGMIWKDARSP